MFCFIRRFLFFIGLGGGLIGGGLIGGGLIGGGLIILPMDAHAHARTVFLTFDDGPRNSTPDILTVLEEEKVPGTFFLIGKHIQIAASRLETFKRLKSSTWVQIGNHSFSHTHENYLRFYENPEGMLQDFQKNNESLGFLSQPYLTRLPGRIDWYFDQRYINDVSYPVANKVAVPEGIRLLSENGFVLYGWDVEWRKVGFSKVLESPEAVARKIKRSFETGNSVKPDKVVLLIHDQHFKGKAAMELIHTLIQLLRQEGYYFNFMGNY